MPVIHSHPRPAGQAEAVVNDFSDCDGCWRPTHPNCPSGRERERARA